MINLAIESIKNNGTASARSVIKPGNLMYNVFNGYGCYCMFDEADYIALESYGG